MPSLMPAAHHGGGRISDCTRTRTRGNGGTHNSQNEPRAEGKTLIAGQMSAQRWPASVRAVSPTLAFDGLYSDNGADENRFSWSVVVVVKTSEPRIIWRQPWQNF